MSFKNRCASLSVTLLMFLPFTVYPQSDTVVVEWSTSWGSICGGPTGNYACVLATGSGDWNNGLRTFTDPIPPGNILKMVLVTVYKVDCGINTLTVTLNGNVVSTECCNGSCNEGECWPTQHVRNEPGGWPDYNYGATNTLQLIPDTTEVCVDRAEIILYYNDTTVNIPFVDTPQICMVTVDTSINQNTVVWDKTIYPALSYNIYKETSPNVFVSIGNVPYGNLTIFTDASSNPDVQPDKYRISIVGTCNNVSELSDPHKSIQLTASIDTIGFAINLNWNAYEGFAFSQYTIWRGTDTSGIVKIDSVSFSVNSYTDPNPPSNTVCYLIEAAHPTGCTATDPPTSFNSTLSNYSCYMDTSIVDVKNTHPVKEAVLVYPNPFNSSTTFILEGDGFSLPVTFELYNVIGEMIKKSPIINHKKFTFSREDLPVGIYYYKITTNKGLVSMGKLMIQ